MISTESAPRCLTYREAKAESKGAYLHWYTERPSRQRCWRPARPLPVKLPPTEEIPLPEPKNVIEPLSPWRGVPVIPEHERPRSLLDSPQWAWVLAAREEDKPESGTIFSSFHPNLEPDSWPKLDEPSWVRLYVALTFVSLASVLIVWRVAKINSAKLENNG